MDSKNTIEKGMKVEDNQNGISNKVNKLINTLKENNKDNEKNITSLYHDISSKVPHCVSKALYKYIEDNSWNYFVYYWINIYN